MRFIYILVFLLGSIMTMPNVAAADNWATCSSIGFCGVNPSLPIFGAGPVTNLGSGSSANTNAVLHVALATAIPLVGYSIAGSRGKWVAGLSWIALTLIQEVVFHAPSNPEAGYPSEVRTDLLTRIVPTVLVLSF